MKILTIGNSFSEDTVEYVYQIADYLGVENITLCNLYIGGCSLSRHAKNARENNAEYRYDINTAGSWTRVDGYRMGDVIKSDNWDFISLQQASGSSGDADTYSELAYMIGYVEGLCPNAQIVWNMTWAYQQDSSHQDFVKYGNDQKTMYDGIISAVKSKVLTNEKITRIIPNGTAIQNAREYMGDTLTRDGYHLSEALGRYIAGLTLVQTLTGISVKDIAYAPAGVDANERLMAIDAVLNAIQEPWKVTEL